MKKLLTILFTLATVSCLAQGGWTRPNRTYGNITYRAAFEKTLFFPTGCGAPVLNAYNLKQSAIYTDTCSSPSKLYWFDPKDSVWNEVTSGGGGGSYTNEEAQDAVGGILASSTKISLTYNDGAPSIVADILAGSIVNADINNSAGIDATKIGTGNVTTTEYGYIGTLISDAQTQLNSKQAAGSYALQSTTINGHTLSSNVVVSASDLTTGTLPASAEPAHTGDVTNNAGSLALAIAADAITQAKTSDYSANSFWANNTGSAANATDFTFKQVDWVTYSETPSWTFTTSAPSGASTAEYTWSQIGKKVEVSFAMAFATPGSGVTAVSLPFPAALPLPDEPLGFGSATDQIYLGSGGLGATAATVVNNNKVALRANAADNGYVFVVQGTSSAIQFCWFTISYRSQ